jgi:ATP-dependent helicase HrpA
MHHSAATLTARFPDAMAVDAERLARRIGRAKTPADWTKIAAELERSIARRAARAAAKPSIDYPPELPVSQRADDIAASIRAHQS